MQRNLITRMHSSRMRTARSLAVSRSICKARPPPPPQMPRCMPSTTRMHSSGMRTAHSLAVSRSICKACPPHHRCPHAPCRACPPPCTPHPATHAPHHTCPLPCTLPPITPLPCTPTPCGQNSWHTLLLKILPCTNFVAGGKYNGCSFQPNSLRWYSV